MIQSDLYDAVLARLGSRPYITETLICQRYRVLESQAKEVIKQLQEQGYIGAQKSPRLGGYPVLEREQVKP